MTNKSKRMDEINFNKFLIIIDTFENKSNTAQKQLLFEICDSDKDGFINESELSIVLELILGSELSKEEITQITLKTLSEFSIDQKALTFEEFIKIIE
jgi:Ca2+-binding EF-hand superfamily protein